MDRNRNCLLLPCPLVSRLNIHSSYGCHKWGLKWIGYTGRKKERKERGMAQSSILGSVSNALELISKREEIEKKEKAKRYNRLWKYAKGITPLLVSSSSSSIRYGTTVRSLVFHSCLSVRPSIRPNISRKKGNTISKSNCSIEQLNGQSHY